VLNPDMRSYGDSNRPAGNFIIDGWLLLSGPDAPDCPNERLTMVDSCPELLEPSHPTVFGQVERNSWRSRCISLSRNACLRRRQTSPGLRYARGDWTYRARTGSQPD